MPRAGPEAGRAHLTPVHRDEAGLPVPGDRTAEFAAGLKADPRRLIAGLQHHGHPPGQDVRKRFYVGELDAPIAGYIELACRAAPPLRLVKIDEAGGHGLARHHLQLWIERGPDRQSAFVEFLFAIAFEDVATDFLGKIFTGEDMRSVGPVGDDQRILAGLVGLGLLDPAVFQQAIDHVVAAFDGAVAVAHRMQRARRLRHRRQIGRFRDREVVHRLVEIDQRGRGNAVGAEPEIDFVEIELEDAILGISALDAHRQQRFLDLAGERHLVGQKEVLRDLLGDRRGTLWPPVRAEILRIQHHRARHAGEVDAAVLVEVLVFGGEERVDHELWNRLDRQIEPALLGIFAEQRAVGGVHARHDRRLIILKLRVVRKVL